MCHPALGSRIHAPREVTDSLHRNLNGSLSPGLIFMGSPFQSRMTSAEAPSSIRVRPLESSVLMLVVLRSTCCLYGCEGMSATH